MITYISQAEVAEIVKFWNLRATQIPSYGARFKWRSRIDHPGRWMNILLFVQNGEIKGMDQSVYDADGDLVTSPGEVYWEAGKDSFTEIIAGLFDILRAIGDASMNILQATGNKQLWTAAAIGAGAYLALKLYQTNK